MEGQEEQVGYAAHGVPFSASRPTPSYLPLSPEAYLLEACRMNNAFVQEVQACWQVLSMGRCLHSAAVPCLAKGIQPEGMAAGKCMHVICKAASS